MISSIKWLRYFAIVRQTRVESMHYLTQASERDMVKGISLRFGDVIKNASARYCRGEDSLLLPPNSKFGQRTCLLSKKLRLIKLSRDAHNQPRSQDSGIFLVNRKFGGGEQQEPTKSVVNRRVRSCSETVRRNP